MLERIPVSEKHEEIARRLCEMLRSGAHVVKKEIATPVRGLVVDRLDQHTYPHRTNTPYKK